MSHSPTDVLTIIVMADGDTDYLFLEKVLKDDPDISNLPICFVRPEELGLKRRTGGGHKTLLREAGLAVIKSAKGFADGVLLLLDNDGDPRFSFPHDDHCGNCRECEAYHAMERVRWGQPLKNKAVILFQALETMLLSTKDGFTPQLEENCFSGDLKIRLYGRDMRGGQEKYEAFQYELEKTDIKKIKAKSYPRLKKVLCDICM